MLAAAEADFEPGFTAGPQGQGGGKIERELWQEIDDELRLMLAQGLALGAAVEATVWRVFGHCAEIAVAGVEWKSRSRARYALSSSRGNFTKQLLRIVAEKGGADLSHEFHCREYDP